MSICCRCQNRVYYHARLDPVYGALRGETDKYRTMCPWCRGWVHHRCFKQETDPCDKGLLKKLQEYVKELQLGTKDEEDSALLVMAAIGFGSNEADLCKFTGLDPEFVRIRAERMRASGIWTEDGNVVLDSDVDMENAATAEIVVCLHMLCAEGEAICKWSSDANKTVVEKLVEKPGSDPGLDVSCLSTEAEHGQERPIEDS